MKKIKAVDLDKLAQEYGLTIEKWKADNVYVFDVSGVYKKKTIHKRFMSDNIGYCHQEAVDYIHSL